MPDEPPIFTVGHSTRSILQFADLLRAGPVEHVIDVRTVPRSRRNPQYDETVLGAELAPHRIEYSRIPELGGLRARSLSVPPEVNGFWENQSFHNYADYALSDDFAAGLDQLLRRAASRRCAIMCSEALWWRCHRRIIADYLLARGRSVLHLMAAGRVEAASLTSAARVEEGRVAYPAMGGLVDQP